MSKNNFNRSFAIILGINNYENGIPALETAAPDAFKLAQIIQEQHTHLKQQYQAQNKYEVQLLLNQRVTLKKLKQLIQDFKKGQIFLDKETVTVNNDDRLLFYFAGHGIALEALDNQDGPVGYLIPQDATLGDSTTYLPMQELHDALSALPCRHMLVILDCCFAGAFRWASLKRDIVPKVTVYKERYDRFISDAAWQVITSAADDQKALDSLGQRGKVIDGNEVHSPFAKALFDALRGGADEGADSNKDGIITATELYSYLRDQVEILTENHYKRQTPGFCPLKKHDKGEFIFLLPNFERDKLADAPPLNVENNPYRGLQSYDEKDSGLFFGRENLIKQLYEHVVVHKQALTVVLGASGTGKSSLMKAGLLPRLRQNSEYPFQILDPMRPGESPLKALAMCLPAITITAEELASSEQALANIIERWSQTNPKTKLLLPVDQFEELITLCKSDEEREQFQKLILNAITKYPNNIHIVITLRLDFEAQFQTSVLKDFWNDETRFVLPPMTQDEFREAIEKPASEKVVYFDPPSLVDELINEVVQMPGALPLLSFTLSELYLKYLGDRTRNNRALTKKDYEELGRVVGSLTKRANQEYDQLVAENSAYKDTVRRVMLRMISLQGAELARRQVPKFELMYPEKEENERVQTVIRCFSDARLIVEGSNSQGKAYVEPAHDALVQGWDKLLAWKKQEEENLILQRRLTPAAEEWNNIKDKEKQPNSLVKAWGQAESFAIGKVQTWRRNWQRQKQEQTNISKVEIVKSIAYLWDDEPRIEQLNQVLDSDDSWLNWIEDNFVRRSVLQRSKNIYRLSLFVTGVILGLSVLSIIATIGQRNAQIGQIKAFQQASDAEWRSNQDFEAVIDALRAGKALDKLLPFGLFKPDAELARVRGTLQKVVYTERVKQYNSLEEDHGHLLSVVFSPDGQTIAVGSTNNSVTIWSLEGIKLQTFTGHDAEVKSVAFSPDGQTIATASDDKTVKLWKRNSTGQFNTQPEQTLTGHGGGVTSIAFSPDGQTIASASDDTTVKLWKRNSTGQFETQPDKTLTGHNAGVKSVAFSPDGQTIVTGSTDSTVKFWSIEGQELQTLRGHNGGVTSVAFSPDGQMLVASANLNGTIKLWKRDFTGQFATQPDITPGVYIRSIRSVAFSPDGQRLALGTEDKTVILLNLQDRAVQTLTGHTGWVSSVAFSPDKKTLTLASSTDRTVKLWRFEGKKLPTLSNVHDAAIWRIAISPNGEMLASADINGTVKLWKWDSTGQLETQPYKNLIGHRYWVWSIAFSPDGKTIATASDDKTVKLWSIKGEELQTLTGHDGGVKSVAFSPDGKTIATASDDKTVKLWKRDDSTGEFAIQPYKTLTGHNGKVFSVAFSPDGQTIATASDDSTVKLWNLDRSQVLRTLTGHKGSIDSVVFSPNGQVLASASFDGSIKLWKRGFTGQFETQPYKTLTGHTTWVTSVAFSPDGQMLASASEDTTVKLWTLEGKELQTLYGHGDGNWIRSIAFRPNDKKIVSAGAGKVILWNLEDFSLDKLMQPACNLVRDYLQNNPNVSESDRHLCDDVPPTTASPNK